jgi:hypothetical protein
LPRHHVALTTLGGILERIGVLAKQYELRTHARGLPSFGRILPEGVKAKRRANALEFRGKGMPAALQTPISWSASLVASALLLGSH